MTTTADAGVLRTTPTRDLERALRSWEALLERTGAERTGRLRCHGARMLEVLQRELARRGATQVRL